MNISDAELKLLIGLPIDIDGLGSIYSPNIREVAKIGESNYNLYLSNLLFSRELLNGDAPKELTDFELFSVVYAKVDDFKEQVDKAFEFFLKSEVHLDLKGGFFYVVEDEKTVGKLDDSNFSIMQDCLRLANYVRNQEKKEDQYNPGDEETARVIAEMLERKRKKPKPKPTMDLRSVISGMAWKCPSIDIAEKTIFQIYDGYKRLKNIDSFHYTMLGIYSGNVDAKKINTQELDFAKILED